MARRAASEIAGKRQHGAWTLIIVMNDASCMVGAIDPECIAQIYLGKV